MPSGPRLACSRLSARVRPSNSRARVSRSPPRAGLEPRTRPRERRESSRTGFFLDLRVSRSIIGASPSATRLRPCLSRARAMGSIDTLQSTSTLLSPQDIYLFKEGTHRRLYQKLGCHFTNESNVDGARFAVWAPNAERVSVFGDFNQWDKTRTALTPRGDESGVWEVFVAGIEPGARYKYHVVSRYDGYEVDKADPFAFYSEPPPATASRAWRLGYDWHDQDWMHNRGVRNALDAPYSIYELHLGSWRRGENNRLLSYRELAPQIAQYAVEMGFTHVELMPVGEHPFYGSWGYQITGYFAPTSRYGTPQDFMFLVDTLHQHGIGVIMDWVPSHFPTDAHVLSRCDGTQLYEHADPLRGFVPDWKTNIFKYAR